MLLHEIILANADNFLSYFEGAVEQREPREAMKKEFLAVADLFDEVMKKMTETKCALTGRAGLSIEVVMRDISPDAEIKLDRCRHYIKILRALYSR